MALKILAILLLFQLIKSHSCLQSTNVLGVYIEWENQGQQTMFRMSSSLGSINNTNEAYLALGINDQPVMVV